MRYLRIAAVLSVGAVVLLAGCTGSTTPNTRPSSTPKATVTVTTAAPTTAPPSTAPAPNTSVLTQYTTWSDKFRTTATAFTDDMAAGNYNAGAGHLKEMTALAEEGKKLPSTGNAKADAEWQGAMADLSAFATLAGSAVRARDPDKLLDSLDLLANVQNHVAAFVNAYTG